MRHGRDRINNLKKTLNLPAPSRHQRTSRPTRAQPNRPSRVQPFHSFAEETMSIKTTIASVAAAALVMGTVMVSSTSEAHARPGWGLGLGIGLAAGALVGAAAASNYGYGYGYGPAYVVPAYPAYRCSWVPQYNYWGAYIGSTR